MGFFNFKTHCAICQTEIKKRKYKLKKNGWICSNCLSKIGGDEQYDTIKNLSPDEIKNEINQINNGKTKEIFFKKISNIIGIIFVIIGLTGIFSSGVLAGFFMILFGLSLMNIVYEKTQLNKYKYIKVILPISLFILFAISVPKVPETHQYISNDNMTNNVIEKEDIKDEKVVISNLELNENNIEMDINETKTIDIKITPKECNIEDIESYSTDNLVVSTEITRENEDNSIIIKALAEGESEIYIKSNNGIISNKVVVKVIDTERIEKERQETEEKARIEEQAKKEAEEKQAEEEERIKREENEKQAQQTTKSQTSTTSNNKTTTSRTVYRTPTGKRYHYDPDCGGKNSTATTLDSAIASGLTPCQKCAK